jgi:hypothetical protein
MASSMSGQAGSRVSTGEHQPGPCADTCRTRRRWCESAHGFRQPARCRVRCGVGNADARVSDSKCWATWGSSEGRLPRLSLNQTCWHSGRKHPFSPSPWMSTTTASLQPHSGTGDGPESRRMLGLLQFLVVVHGRICELVVVPTSGAFASPACHRRWRDRFAAL